MFETHFYDEIYGEQRHLRIIERVCRRLQTEEDVIGAPEAFVDVGCDARDSRELPDGDAADWDAEVPMMGDTAVRKRARAICLLDNSEDCLLAEIGKIPYVPAPAASRRVRTRPETLLSQSTSMKDIVASCVLPSTVPVLDVSTRFKNRHYHIGRSGVVVLVPD